MKYLVINRNIKTNLPLKHFLKTLHKSRMQAIAIVLDEYHLQLAIIIT